MRIIIAGSRTFNNYELLKETCLKILKYQDPNGFGNLDLEIVSGRAQGADLLGEKFAKEFNIPVKQFPANWDLFGKSAGYKRNEQMAKYAAGKQDGVLIAYWDYVSKGTKHMIDLGIKYNLKVFMVDFEGKILQYKNIQ